MLRLITVASMVLLLFAFAGSALAQPIACGFYGYASIDGDGVDNGTQIKAWIDGVEIESVETSRFNNEGYTLNYILKFQDGKDYTGKTVMFTIGPNNLTAGSTEWTAGGYSRLDMDASSGGSSPPATLSPPSITLYPTEGIATQVSGKGFTPGSSVSIKVGGQPSGSIIANTDSTFSIVIAAPTQNPGTYTVSVKDSTGRSAQAVLTVPDIRGEPGDTGAKGAEGKPGKAGPKGDSASGMALAALILSIIAIVGVGLVAIRISTYWRRR